MIVTLLSRGLQTWALLRAFACGNEANSFTLTDRHAAYGWMADTLVLFNYAHCSRADKGVLRQYLFQVNVLTTEVLSPYLNFHRHCHFPTEYTDAKGKIRKRYY